MVCGVDHVAIAAKDSRALVDWYCDVLGMRVVYDNGKTPPTCLVGGDMGAVIEIMPDNGATPVNHHPHDPGFRHLALRVRDFDSAYAELQEHHSAGRILALMPAAAAAGGGQIAFFSDLEGNLVQIVSRPEELL